MKHLSLTVHENGTSTAEWELDEPTAQASKPKCLGGCRERTCEAYRGKIICPRLDTDTEV